MKRINKTMISCCACCFVLLCILLYASIYNTGNGDDEDITVIRKSGLLANVDQSDLIRTSAVVIYGELENKSEPFIVMSTSGDKSVYTDYYIKPTYVLRGEKDMDRVTVRVEGGVTNDLIVENEGAPILKSGTQYLLFLKKPIRGGFTTEGEYYYINGAVQGVYEIKSASEAIDCKNINDIAENKTHIEMCSQEPISTSLDLGAMIEKINDVDSSKQFDVDILEKDYRSNLKKNLDNGIITEEYYNICIDELSKTATYVE